jgi:6-oxo-cyclohex-1-ene-carbonyl-CoA hydrolase
MIVPALRVDDRFVANPLVWTDNAVDDAGRLRLGEAKTGQALDDAKALVKAGRIDLSLLDREVDAWVTKLLMTMPGCLTKTVESVRKHKLAWWDRNRETNRAWLALNITTEGNAGFRAFNDDDPPDRTVDFVELRRAIAEGAPWNEDLVDRARPRRKR